MSDLSKEQDLDFNRLQSLRDQITVVIPTFNEEKSIGRLLKEIKSCGYYKNVVVDGYSSDGTEMISQQNGAKVIKQHGVGKAGALNTAFKLVNTSHLVVMDGDGSYDPKDIDRFLELLDEFEYVKGYRIVHGNMSALHRLGNYIITKTFNLLFGTNIQDICSGMFMLKTDVAKDLHFDKHPFSVEQEITAQLAVSPLAITSVPINYRKRFGGKSKVNTWKQGFRDLLTNFDLARTHNPVLLFSLLAALAIIPAVAVLGYALYLDLFFSQYHSGYFLFSIMLFVLGAQGLTVATIAALLRRIEQRLKKY